MLPFKKMRSSNCENVITTNTSNRPELPLSVQRNLLQAGMRIRKAVAEGYQTKPKPATGCYVPGTVSARKRGHDDEEDADGKSPTSSASSRSPQQNELPSSSGISSWLQPRQTNLNAWIRQDVSN